MDIRNVDQALRVCSVTDVPRGTCREFPAGRRTVLICNYNGEFFAHSAACPHEGRSLDGASLWGDVIDCPWHHYTFNVVTGENVYPSSVRPADRPDLLAGAIALRTYPVQIRDGNVFVALENAS